MNNTMLIEYGIFQYESDYCIHVSPVVTKKLFLYKTKLMQDLIANNEYRKVNAYQNYNGLKITSAEGYLVPCNEGIISSVSFPCPTKKYCEKSMTTGEKGELAVAIVMYCLKKGMVAFEFDVGEIKNENMQIAGNDIIAVSDFKIQVKCDWAAGPVLDGGTGNLFVQTKECNPLGLH